MAIKHTLVTAVAVVAALALIGAGLTGAGFGISGDTGVCVPAPTAGAPSAPASSGLDDEQTGNATTIAATGARLGVPQRGWVIAVATAMQESALRNLAGGDRDSVGLFQQRPSMGWGTAAQLRDPRYAATAFYQRLVKVAGWEQMPLTVAAQAVQRSAYPDAYAKHESAATALVNTIAAGAMVPVCPPVGAQGWVAPVTAPVVSGFRTADRPGHQGVDLGAARGTLIRAAAAGRVVQAVCNVSPPEHGCDQDGSPAVGGCGWYADLDHGAGVITRYCHMAARPLVHIGQHVPAGAPLGHVGSSGNSSGPHLHFEVHLRGDAGPSGAVPPLEWMAAHGAPLGQT
ncbi:hypothetical protein GCM10010124_31630 [Pilimelia terevasa]|uniref:M23ase beta-sheet core domain-containing protein n=1 Tax=Pilimelia terevasa TaxID=53372 RepID=A0A8J3BVG9_9ACTN|nr:M23 family metallopeptidase [Pilimelia terevasa]GGK36662.1 hypothetical protein GCM10010124_31630 [Pilimelia terevasa]